MSSALINDHAGWSIWPAPAKLNLFLHIVGQRADGYHLLQTAFQLLNWGDSIRLRVRADCEISRAAELPGVALQSDLCLRAAKLLQEYTATPLGADIAVEKRIPMGGGLGGGSSDAASVLVGLNILWQTGLDIDTLAALGLRLGADVPVFVRGHSAWAEGIGDELTAITLAEQVYVILDPRVSVPTAELFRAPELTRNTPRGTIRGLVSGELVANSFAPVVRARFAAVDAAMHWLDQFGAARLSGSGGCVFAAMSNIGVANVIAQQCPPEFVAHVACGINVSPLLKMAQEFSVAG
jgi:4-diphosphocytidyl-2-C-methyl-D-erythritol kinase